MPADDRLDSWKEIAAYLDREVRTVQLWEKTEGLPVHRHVHSRQGTVYAFKSELDAWLQARKAPAAADSPPESDRQPTKRVAFVAWVTGAALAALALGLAFWLP